MISIEQRQKLSELDDCYYSTKELSKFLGISVSTLSKYRLQGVGPKYFRVGYRTCRYAKKDILQYMEASRRNSTSDTGDSR